MLDDGGGVVVVDEGVVVGDCDELGVGDSDVGVGVGDGVGDSEVGDGVGVGE